MSNQDGQTAVELRQPSSASGGAAGAAASDDAVASKHQYVEKAALIEVLRGGNMRLLKPEFILERHRRGLLLPHRSDLELLEKAQGGHGVFLDVDALSEEQQTNLEVISISYCWLSPDHPDPKGFHLATLAKLLGIFCKGTATTTEFFNRDKGYTLGAGDGRPVGVVLDWCGMYQDKPRGARTEAQQAKFDAALRTISLWYAHQQTVVWLLNYLPPDQPPTPAWTDESGKAHPEQMRAAYADSGWPTFERRVASILTRPMDVLNVTLAVRDELMGADPSVYDEGNYPRLCTRALDFFRGAPLAPASFDDLLDRKEFANGADADQIVKPAYSAAFKAMIAEASHIGLSELRLDDAAAAPFAPVLREHCLAIQHLDLSKNKIAIPVDEWAEALSGGVALQLKTFNVEQNSEMGGQLSSLSIFKNLQTLRIGNTKVCGSLNEIASLVHLKNLGTKNCLQLGGSVADLRDMTRLEDLDIYRCAFGGALGDLLALPSLTSADIAATKIILEGDKDDFETLAKKVTTITVNDDQFADDGAKVFKSFRPEKEEVQVANEDYAAKHNLNAFFVGIVQAALVDLPSDVPLFIYQYLQEKFPESCERTEFSITETSSAWKPPEDEDATPGDRKLNLFMQYANLNPMFLEIIQYLLVHRPDDPMKGTYDYFQSKYPEKCK